MFSPKNGIPYNAPIVARFNINMPQGGMGVRRFHFLFLKLFPANATCSELPPPLPPPPLLLSPPPPLPLPLPLPNTRRGGVATRHALAEPGTRRFAAAPRQQRRRRRSGRKVSGPSHFFFHCLRCKIFSSVMFGAPDGLMVHTCS